MYPYSCSIFAIRIRTYLGVYCGAIRIACLEYDDGKLGILIRSFLYGDHDRTLTCSNILCSLVYGAATNLDFSPRPAEISYLCI